MQLSLFKSSLEGPLVLTQVTRLPPIGNGTYFSSPYRIKYVHTLSNFLIGALKLLEMEMEMHLGKTSQLTYDQLVGLRLKVNFLFYYSIPLMSFTTPKVELTGTLG